MRFFQNGPSFPDNLLRARDEGRVVFFCGAGVSRERAKLPDFYGLASQVISALGVSTDSPISKMLEEAPEVEERIGVSGLISADRMFGLLERDFSTRDIESAVAQALRPPQNVDLSAHQILLNLATTPEGKVRLVTTNFDLLFEDCNEALHVWEHPRLPDPLRENDMDGITHLHGRVTSGYDGAEGDGFILSSSEFGRAYLAEGWATKFFKEILDRFFVVFIGYTADDPPVQYLLEALNKKPGLLRGVYAFQPGTQSNATAMWHHRGVEAIAYDDAIDHSALWESLEAWSERAKNSEEWFDVVIEMARKGPEILSPHERGQVMHVLSSLEGARKFAKSDPPPPASWLCVLDQCRRYASPKKTWRGSDQEAVLDPFDIFGLDFDVLPDSVDPDDYLSKRKIPDGAWDGFSPNSLDYKNPRVDDTYVFRGHWATSPRKLPSRLDQIAVWISKVADQPISIWWAAHQLPFHPDIQKLITRELELSTIDSSPIIRRAWQYLFEAWAHHIDEYDGRWFDLDSAIKKNGFDSASIRKFATLSRPYLSVEHSFNDDLIAVCLRDDIKLGNLIRLDVEHPKSPVEIIIPDELLLIVVRELRKCLEHALILEAEIGGFGLRSIAPITPYDSEEENGREYDGDLSGSIRRFADLFERLVNFDIFGATNEFSSWPSEDGTIFTRLRIWASGNSQLMPDENFKQFFKSINQKLFWDDYHQRDLLLVLAKRWKGLSANTRKELEDKLLVGPERWGDIDDTVFKRESAFQILNRILWLAENGCEFTFNLATKTDELRAIAIDWKPEYASKAADFLTTRVYSVETKTEHSTLLNEPIGSILSKAFELSGRSSDRLVQNDPFSGLSTEHPVRALTALTIAAKQGEYPEWAWKVFLRADAQKTDNVKFKALIAERLASCPDEVLGNFIHTASRWLEGSSNSLAQNYIQSFDKVVLKFIAVLQLPTADSGLSLVRGNKKPDWVMEAINSPTGKVAMSIFSDPRKDKLVAGDGFPAEWVKYVNDLISLTGDLRRHAFVVFARNLNWFFAIDPNWTEENLLSVLDNEGDEDRNAIWDGFFWGTKVPNQILYMRIKQNLLALKRDTDYSDGKFGKNMAGVILAGWGSLNDETNERCVSNDEMRDLLLDAGDKFRVSILWQADVWSRSQNEKTNLEWPALLLELIQDVWPRQTVAKSSKVSAQLCRLTFSDLERFPQLVEAIFPLLTTIDRNDLMLQDISNGENSIARRYPEHTLRLFYVILPENVEDWPYRIERTLNAIVESDNTLIEDPRWQELNRKWNSR